MTLTAWGSRTSSEPQERTESRTAGLGPLDELRTENGKVLSSADNGVTATKLASWRKTYKHF